jgi:hypothetical protein
MTSKRPLDDAATPAEKRTLGVFAYFVPCEGPIDCFNSTNTPVVEFDVVDAFEERFNMAVRRRVLLPERESDKWQWVYVYNKQASTPNRNFQQDICGPVAIYQRRISTKMISDEHKVRELPPYPDFSSFEEALDGTLAVDEPVAAYFAASTKDCPVVPFRMRSAHVQDIHAAFVKWVERTCGITLHTEVVKVRPGLAVICDEQGRLPGAHLNENLELLNFPIKLRGPVCIYKPSLDVCDRLVKEMPELGDGCSWM